MMTVMAAKAGKDVYCEKPTALTVHESRAIVEATNRYARVFQAGTQQRSEYGGKFRLACELVRSGRIGKLQTVYAYEQGGGFAWKKSFAPEKPVPPEVDWNLYIGPAPWSPFDGNLDAHRFGFGGINWGQHHYDIVEWGVGLDTDPVEFTIADDGRPTMRYADGVTVHGSPYPDPTLGLGPNVRFAGEGGVVFVGTEGKIAVDRQQILSNPAEILRTPLRADETKLYFSQSHSGNFLECVKTRKRTICDPLSTHRAAKLLLLAGIAEQLKRPLRWDPSAERFIDDEPANRLLSVAYRPPWRI
jgi:predicted dehydrogenase